MDEIKTFLTLRNSGIEGWAFTAIFLALMLKGLFSFLKYFLNCFGKLFDLIVLIKTKKENIDSIPEISQTLHEIKEAHRLHEQREERSFVEIRKDFNDFKKLTLADSEEIKKHITEYKKRTHSLENEKNLMVNQIKDFNNHLELLQSDKMQTYSLLKEIAEQIKSLRNEKKST